MLRTILFTALLLVITPTLSLSETLDFGGSDDRFKGGGDKTPPQCQINYPRAATSPFFIRWNCEDDVTSPDAIQSELWITRQGADIASRQIEKFLGFPAAAFIDERQLGTATFTEGLPASFRLIARDLAGNAAISDLLTIRSQDTSISNCTVDVVTEGTAAVGGTTGIPALRTTISNAPVSVTAESSLQTVNIISSSSTTADPCEIDLVCLNSQDLNFASRITSQSSGVASGTLTIPGSVSVELSGTATFDNAVVTGLELEGTTEIDNTAATVNFTCSR